MSAHKHTVASLLIGTGANPKANREAFTRLGSEWMGLKTTFDLYNASLIIAPENELEHREDRRVR